MSKRILLIVEGKTDEQNVLGNAFRKYGFETIVSNESLNIENIGAFRKFEYSSSKDNVVIIQGPRNRIHDFLKLIRNEYVSIEKIFSYAYAFFQNIFLIYDVDHNDCSDVSEMFSRFSDESSGMLLLSSPCLEVLADYDRNRTEERYSHLSEYKADINKHYNGGTFEYIAEHLNEIMLYFLDKNYNEFHEENVLVHPAKIVDKINELNIRKNYPDKSKSFVVYRYFSTVLYVAISCAFGLTKEIDNYSIVRDFFLGQIAKEKHSLVS